MIEKRFTRFWLIIILALLLAVAILVLWNISLNATEQATTNQFQQQQLEQVTAAAVGIEDYFESIADEIRSLGRLPEIHYFEELPARQALRDSYLRLEPLGVTTVGIMDRNGIHTYTATGRDIEGVDLSWRNYFQEAKAMHNDENYAFQFIDLQIADPGQVSIIMAIPLFESAVDQRHPTPSGEFAGVADAAFRETTLYQNLVASHKPLANGHVFLANSEAFILWSSDGESIGRNLGDDGLSAFHSIVENKESWSSGHAEASSYEFPGNGDEAGKLIAFAPVELGNELWVIGVWSPEDDAQALLQPIYQGQQFVIGFAILTIILGAILGGYELRRETKQRVRAEEALHEIELETAVVTERSRIAGDLHDAVTQTLFSASIIAEVLPKIWQRDPQEGQRRLAELRELTRGSLAEMRTLLLELRPVGIIESDMEDLLQQLAESIIGRARIPVTVKINNDYELPENVKITMYRIAQESLNNIAKHARASQVNVSLQDEGKNVILSIIDDGIGFTPEDNAPDSLGLNIMQERAAAVGVQLTINSEPEVGTEILASWPKTSGGKT